ncbi:MAG: hypothetical protein A3D67_03950 [Candidatus Lloydbacteria bacterium RIFCSPHIGHO2_02_FULL_51_22]|uniref:HTH luxR-type domain-containing protein n=2 Tax=Candidatus Lloydiibacteriota TaxID=1817910 RepID=A0A1G2DBW0_9BACT|nr:MAG: hypothetical protein A3D67_03950 [Candidatus Lloydbacteria bacterium RIFCSPHIGHO2_02_FULL_51_22]OGZ15011.1 MAG: hypothetical protein A3J08_01525 [Candidatus Lloydbacteria bacterium RIFCSPLOWO2_02_FULL_51_11]
MDTEAQFLKAFDEYADAIFKHCMFRVSDRDVAKDIVQDTFCRAWNHVARGGEVREYRPFLYKIATNLITDFYRKKKPVSLDELSDREMNSLSHDEREQRENADDVRRVRREIEKLPEKERVVVLMRYIDDLSPKEIAVVLGEKENAVSVRIHRAVEKLRDIFKEL